LKEDRVEEETSMGYSAFVLPVREWSEAEMARVMPRERDPTTKPTFIPLKPHGKPIIKGLNKPGGINSLRGDYPSGVVLLVDPLRMVEVKIKGSMEVDYGKIKGPLRITGGNIKGPLSVVEEGSIMGSLVVEDGKIIVPLAEKVGVSETDLEILPKSSAILPLYWIEPDQAVLDINLSEVEEGIVILFRPYVVSQGEETQE
jgi:hypothetical protein